MPHFKPGYGPDGTPKQPKKPSVPAKKYGPDGYPVHHETSSRQWIPEKEVRIETDLNGLYQDIGLMTQGISLSRKKNLLYICNINAILMVRLYL